MKKSNWIFASTLFAFLLSATIVSAQNYNHNNGYDYDDNVVLINDYDGDRNYRDGNRKRNKKRIRQERQWKANILDRAYRIARADGRITRGEKRELRMLERDLGIQRRGRGHHKNNRR